MTEQSTEELKRQYVDAKSKLIEANSAMNSARDAYKSRLVSDCLADFAALGIHPGEKVVAVHIYWGEEKRTVCTFIGVEISSWSDKPSVILGKLKKDGSPSKMRKTISFDSLEPFDGGE